MNRKIPFLENPKSLTFNLPDNIPHHVMIKDVSDDPDDIAYYRKFVARTYSKYIMTYETGRGDNNPHYHIVGFNDEEKNKFSNFKRGKAKLRKASSEDTKYPHILALMDKYNLNSTHMKIYYILKEQTDLKDNVYSNLDEDPLCINGYIWIMSQLPKEIKKKTKMFKEQNKSFLSQLIEEYPIDEINKKCWNDDRQDRRQVKSSIVNHCLQFCRNWNLTKSNAKSLAKKNFRDFCYTIWMQYYVYPSGIHNTDDELYEDVWGSYD